MEKLEIVNDIRDKLQTMYQKVYVENGKDKEYVVGVLPQDIADLRFMFDLYQNAIEKLG